MDRFSRQDGHIRHVTVISERLDNQAGVHKTRRNDFNSIKNRCRKIWCRFLFVSWISNEALVPISSFILKFENWTMLNDCQWNICKTRDQLTLTLTTLFFFFKEYQVSFSVLFVHGQYRTTVFIIFKEHVDNENANLIITNVYNVIMFYISSSCWCLIYN